MNNRFRLPLAAAALVISASTANAQVRPIPATKTPVPATKTPVALPPTGLVLPLVEPPGGIPAPASYVPFAKAGGITTLCNPKQTLPGPGPASFILVARAPSGLYAMWPEVPGAVAYVVERAIDGTTAWTLVGSTCGGPSPLWRQTYISGNQVGFLDIVPGVVTGTTYVYKVTAIGASGATGWNSTRWVAPATTAPHWITPTITGSTVVLALSYRATAPNDFGPTPWARSPDEFVVTSDFGFTINVRAGHDSDFCSGEVCKVTALGVPMGTHTFNVTGRWLQRMDPALPLVVFTRAGAPLTVTIKP